PAILVDRSDLVDRAYSSERKRPPLSKLRSASRRWFCAAWRSTLTRQPLKLDSAPPILFGLTLHRWRVRIFDFHPILRPTPAINRAEHYQRTTITVTNIAVRSAFVIVIPRINPVLAILIRACNRD